MAGRYWDDFDVGDWLEHALHRTVAETDNLRITPDPQSAAAAP